MGAGHPTFLGKGQRMNILDCEPERMCFYLASLLAVEQRETWCTVRGVLQRPWVGCTWLWPCSLLTPSPRSQKNTMGMTKTSLLRYLNHIMLSIHQGQRHNWTFVWLMLSLEGSRIHVDHHHFFFFNKETDEVQRLSELDLVSPQTGGLDPRT